MGTENSSSDITSAIAPVELGLSQNGDAGISMNILLTVGCFFTLKNMSFINPQRNEPPPKNAGFPWFSTTPNRSASESPSACFIAAFSLGRCSA